MALLNFSRCSLLSRCRCRPNSLIEYLGEAYVQAALEQVQILKSYGAEADRELEDLKEAFRKAAQELQ